MEIGLDTYSYHLAFGKHPDRRANGPMTLAKCLNKARSLEVETVQVDPMHFDSEKDNPRWVKRMADGLGIRLEASSAGVDKSRLLRDLEVAAAWGSPVLRTFLGWDLPRTLRHPADRIEAAAADLREIVREAEGLGIAIAIENRMDVSTPDLLSLVKAVDSPWVAVCLNVANSLVCMEEPAWTVEQLAPHAVSCHVKDYRWEPTTFGAKLTGAPVGKGIVDMAAVLDLLGNAPRLKHVILECATEAVGSNTEMLASEEAAIKESLTYLRTCSGKGR